MRICTKYTFARVVRLSSSSSQNFRDTIWSNKGCKRLHRSVTRRRPHRPSRVNWWWNRVVGGFRMTLCDHFSLTQHSTTTMYTTQRRRNTRVTLQCDVVWVSTAQKQIHTMFVKHSVGRRVEALGQPKRTASTTAVWRQHRHWAYSETMCSSCLPVN